MKNIFKVLIAPLAMVLVASHFHVFAQIVHKEKIIAAWEWAKAYTKEYLDAATQEVYDFKPTPEIRSFAEQMHHLAVDNYKIVKEALPPGTQPANYKGIEKTEIKTKAEITQAVMDSYDFALAAIKSIENSKLDEVIKISDGKPPWKMVLRKPSNIRLIIAVNARFTSG